MTSVSIPRAATAIAAVACLALGVWAARTHSRLRREASVDAEKAAQMLDRAQACQATAQAYLNEARWRGAGKAQS